MSDHILGSDRADSESTTQIGTGTVPAHLGLDQAEPDIPSTVTHGSTAEQVADRRKLEEWADRLNLNVSDVEVFCRNGFECEKIPPQNTPSRRAMLAHLKRREIAPSRWLMISGLFPDVQFSEPERRKRLRALYKVVTLLSKRALAREAVDPNKHERSIYWDPVAEVCRELEIAQSKLSSLLKEFSGSSLTQTIDCVRAEQIQKVMRRKIRSFVRDFRTQCASLVRENGEAVKCSDANSTPVPLTPNPSPPRGEGNRTLPSPARGEGDITRWDVWKALKASRKWPEFCSNSWALEFGFSSYRRMYRACVAVWKQTPHQLEMALIAECLKFNETSEIADTSFDEISLSDIESQIRAVQCYCEDS